MPCSASIRLSIRWLPDDPYEDCNVIVLSVGTHFLDVRVKDHSRIDRAFSGEKHTDSDGKSIWTHDIDSRGWTDEDSGYILPINDTDELERGSIKTPDNNNQVMAHEEVWRKLPLAYQKGIIARNQKGTEWLAVVDCHILRLHVEAGQFSVARYTMSELEERATTIYSIGTNDFGGFNQSTIRNLFEEEPWTILAQEQ